MDAIKQNRATLIFLMIVFIPLTMLSQKSKFPKDTIYVKYTTKKGNKKIMNWNYRGTDGIYFSIKEENGKHISLFHPNNKSLDTLCYLHLKDYKTLNLKEIREKEINWVDRKYKGKKYKPYSGGGLKNSAFLTYLIEVISEEKFVIYPVIWRNEGVID